MLNTIISICIFLIVLFLYIHIIFHHKTCDDLEVFVIDDLPHKDKWEELCNLKQPILLKQMQHLNSLIQHYSLPSLEDNYSMFDVYVQQYQSENSLPMNLHTTIELLKRDETYYSSSNQEFIKETGIIKYIKSKDMFLRPPMCSQCIYDMWFGNNTCTPTQYMFYHRTYLIPTFNDIEITLIPPKYTKYMNPIYDYEHFMFKSLYNPWNTSEQQEWSKIKSLSVHVQCGELVYIPPYWWFSIKFNSMASVYLFSYLTYMNMLSQIHHYTKYFLQKQNIKQDIITNKIQLQNKQETNLSNVHSMNDHHNVK